MIDIIIVSRWNTQVGIPDAAMLIGDLTLYPMVRRLILLPLLILAAKVCPDGAEATIFSMLVSLNNLGATVSIYNGSFLLITFGVNEDNYDNFVWVILIKSLCRLLPILLIPFLIPIGAPQEEDDDKEDVEHNYDDSIMTSIIPEEIEIGSIRSSNIILPESLNQKFAQHRQSDHSATQRSYVIRPRRKYKRQSLIY